MSFPALFKINPEDNTLEIEALKISVNDLPNIPAESLQALGIFHEYTRSKSEEEDIGPFTFDKKEPGDLIKSADWNQAMREILRLGSGDIYSQGPLKDLMVIHGYVGQHGASTLDDGFVFEVSEDKVYTVMFTNPFKERPVVIGAIDFGSFFDQEESTGRTGNPPQPHSSGVTSGRSGTPASHEGLRNLQLIDFGLESVPRLIISITSNKTFNAHILTLREPEIVVPFSFVAIGKR